MPRFHKSAPHHSVHHSRKDVGMSEGMYDSREQKERLEHHDGSMITEDHSAVANMPQEVIMRPWQDHETYMPESLDDTIHGIDKQITYDDSKRREHFMPKKV